MTYNSVDFFLGFRWTSGCRLIRRKKEEFALTVVSVPPPYKEKPHASILLSSLGVLRVQPLQVLRKEGRDGLVLFLARHQEGKCKISVLKDTYNLF
jgi:hypothetical protein